MQIIKSIESRIYEVRGERVMLDFDLASLYEVQTRVLNQAVKRNIKRFPEDFMFQLTKQEFENLQTEVSNQNMSSQIDDKRPQLDITICDIKLGWH
ncbi:ORF6N domain-containing protein [Pedobacter aquatilis]|uniref:ORF6N domain-containing protein n=1 Tax=Pedobacter aquatilis TaxID=351343 RepID=UPI0025B5E75C|nr:ORF6N domain-containing protein [Pedobacter aquatilis]MDN3585895.1 ORF6N domain-containing protein [Pedobacter aquatilis]